MNSVVTVYCDFDGTITPTDTVKLLLQELADPEWEAFEQEFIEGKITYRECLLRQIKLIRWDIQAIRGLIENIPVDPSFIKLAQCCHKKDIPLIIVSEGIQQIIEMVLAREGILVSDVWANKLIKLENESPSLEFCLPPSREKCSGKFCKCKHLAPKNCLLNVLIGEDFIEPCWIKNADMIFARTKLLAHCHKNKIPFQKFTGFEHIQQELENCLSQIRPNKWKPLSCPDISIFNPLLQ